MDRITEAYNGTYGTPEMKRKTHERIHWICSKVRGQTLLDVGCSQGITALLLARTGFTVRAVDINPEAIEFAKNCLTQEAPEVQSRARFECASFYTYDMGDVKFDSVLFGEVLEHLVAPERFIENAWNVLREGGRVVVTVPFGILDDPEHVRTFYFMELYQTLYRLFAINEIKYFGTWIGFVGTKRDKPLMDEPPIEIEQVLALEQACFKKEREQCDFAIKLREDIKRIQENLAKVTKERADAQTQLVDSNQQIDVLQKDLITQKETNFGLEEMNVSLQGEITSVKAQIDVLQKEMLEYKKEIVILEGQTKNLQAELATEKVVKEKFQEVLHVKERSLAETENMTEHLKCELSAAKECTSALQNELLEQKKVLAESTGITEALKRELSETKVRVDVLQKDLFEQKEVLAEAKGVNLLLEKELANSKDREASLQDELREQNISLTDLRNVNTELNEKLLDSTKQSVALQGDLHTMDTSLATLTDANKDLTAEIASVNVLVEKLREELLIKENELLSISSELTKLKGGVVQEANQKDALQKSLSAKEKELALATSELTKLKGDVLQKDALQKSLSAKEKELSLMKTDNAKIKEELAVMSGKVMELAKKVKHYEVTIANFKRMESKYVALAKSKLGRLTLAYWGLKTTIKNKFLRKPIPSTKDVIAVIIPTYKDNPWVDKAVESILNQRCPTFDVEVLVCVNGGNRTYYRRLNSTYKGETRVKVLYSAKKGANVARNLGLANTKAKYISFLDDDDFFTPGFLNELKGGFVSPDVIFSCGRLADWDLKTNDFVKDESYIVKNLKAIGKGIHFDYDRIATVFSSFNAKLYRADFFRSLGALDESSIVSEDVLFWVENIHKVTGGVAIMNPDGRDAYVRRLTAGSLSRPLPEKEYAFYITERLSVLERIEKTIFSPLNTKEKKLFILGKIKAQMNIMKRFFEGLPEELKEKARKEIFNSKNVFLNRSIFSNRRAIGFCHNFSPTIDASALVATKRLNEINALEGDIFNWTIISQNMSTIRVLDMDFQRFFADFTVAEKIELAGSFGFLPSGQMNYANAAFARAQQLPEPELMYSRSLFAGSHIAAFEYKKLHPKVKWYAEFSDPLAYGVDNNPRPCKGEPTWFDIEAMVYQNADKIIFTNANQLEFMLSYNADKSLNESIRKRAVVKHHPIMPRQYCDLMTYQYAMDKDAINVAFFGTFYVTRKCDDMLNIMQNKKVVLHIFTTTPDDVKKTLPEEYKDRIRVNSTISQFEFLNLAARMDYLILTDTEFPGEINPFLPSKLADYLVTGSKILARVQSGSPLSSITHEKLIKCPTFTSEIVSSLKKKNA